MADDEAPSFMYVRWFGPSWHAPVNNPERAVQTPTGQRCFSCQKVIILGDRGYLIAHSKSELTASYEPWHLRCFLGETLGWDEPLLAEVDEAQAEIHNMLGHLN